ncbi:hypothetical protein KUCAC02_025469 [Chaenocephalus aceratus]|uniref:Uncharacterized protein n=1 Tax=Chaenocephalus aceratus TaxID=36190 RepID=A0ACB9VUI8_CHAAC|nr:hypothetical protein KUCAC02_025469 [Chaenocephalus aceratus]
MEADGCSVAAQPPPSPPKCEAAVVGMAQCEREPEFMTGNRKAVGGAFGGWGKVGAESCFLGGALEKLVGQASCNGRESQSPLSHPFEIQGQGHRPREEWQRGPAPGQTGSHRTGAASPALLACPFPPQPTPSAHAYGSQAGRPPSGQAEPCTY